nr:myosin-11-like [Nothobranchius furzeri]
METIIYQEDINWLNNLLTAENHERCQDAKVYFSETIKKMSRASQVVIKAFEDEQKSHNETKKNYEQTIETLKEKDCLIISLQEGIATAEAKVLAAEKRANDYKQMFLEEQTAHHEVRRSYKETVNTLIETDDCLKVSLKELEKEKASHAKTRETQQNIILTIQAQHDAIRLQTIKAAQEMGRQFEQKIRQLEENLEQKDVLYQSLDDRYRAELSDVKQLMENLNQELEEEKQIRKEREDIIFTIQAEKEDLCSQMQQQTSDLNKLYDETTRNFMRQLEEKDVLYQSLEQKCETQLSERHQLIESLKHELDTKRQQHFDALQEIQAQRDATRLQTIKAAQEMGRQFEQKIRQLEENLEQKDVLYQSLDDKYRAELSESRQQVEHLHRELEKEAKVLAAEKRANDYKQMFLEEQTAHHEVRRSYKETVNTLIETDDCLKVSLKELEKEKASHAKTRETQQNIILTIQAQHDAIRLQTIKAAQEMGRQFEQKIRQLEENLEQKDVLYQNLEQKCETQLSERHQLIESLKHELDTKRQQHFDALQEIQAQRDATRLQTIKAAQELGRQFEQKIRQLEENLEQKDVLYQSLDNKYRAELSESRQQVEHLHRELEKEAKARKENEEMIRIVQDEKVELYNQMEDKARAMERQFETEKRNFMKDLEEREASCQDLEKKYKTEVFNSKRQIESLQQEMEKEREEAAQTILTIQSEKEALRVQMEQQLDVEKSKLQEELNKGEGLYRDLRKKYMELFFVAAHL